MAKAVVSDISLFAPGTPIRVKVSDSSLQAPPESIRIVVSDVELQAPGVTVVQATSLIRYKARIVVNGTALVQANQIQIVITPHIRVQVSGTQHATTAVIRYKPRIVVSAGQQRRAYEVVSVHYKARILVSSIIPVPVAVLSPLSSVGVLHLAWPVKLARDGSLQSLTQDTDAEVLQAAAVLLSTSPGSRRGRPEFGFRDPTFATKPPTATEIDAAVTEWDDRVTSVATEVNRDGDTTLLGVALREDVT